MRRVLVSLALVAGLAPVSPVRSGTVLELAVTDGAAEPTVVRLALQDGSLRLDRGPAGGPPATSLILRRGAEEVLFLDHAMPQTFVYDPHTVHRIGQAMALAGDQPPPEPPTLLEGGESGISEGLSWSRIEIRSGGDLVAEARATTATELGLAPGELSAYVSLLEALGPVADSFGPILGLGFPADPGLARLAAADLFPVTYRRLIDGEPAADATLESVESRPLDSELFGDPGYPQPKFEMHGH